MSTEARCAKGHTYQRGVYKNHGCPECRRIRQREYRRETKNIHTHNYERTPRGFLMRAYRNLESRCKGLVKPHIYAGLEYLARDEFYAWFLDNPQFWRLYRNWVASGYDRRLSPSVNRIDPDRGYTIDNIEWLTHSVNSSLSRSAPRKALERLAKSVSA